MSLAQSLSDTPLSFLSSFSFTSLFHFPIFNNSFCVTQTLVCLYYHSPDRNIAINLLFTAYCRFRFFLFRYRLLAFVQTRASVISLSTMVRTNKSKLSSTQKNILNNGIMGEQLQLTITLKALIGNIIGKMMRVV